MQSYRKYRPKKLDDVVGQEGAIKALKSLHQRGEIPQCILLSGPSGVGKTTVARILARMVKCNKADFYEVNASSKRGIDFARYVESRVRLSPVSGQSRVWLIDEAHQLTGDAQNALLKVLEDTPENRYFFLSTTEPQKLKKTIHTRAHQVKLGSLKEKDLRVVVGRVLELEKVKLSAEVKDKLAACAEGSARQVLNTLDSIMRVETKEEQLEIIQKNDYQGQAREIGSLLFNRQASWPDMVKVLSSVEEGEESIRYGVLALARIMLFKGGTLGKRASEVIEQFQDNFYESKKAGLALACYNLMRG